MGDKPFIKFYPSDFLGGTSGLSPAERGVYITLLCLIYENDGPIDRDDGRLARRCGMPKAAFLRVLAALLDEGKLTQDGGMLANRRAEKALVDRQNRTQIATHAAHSRWNAQEEKTKRKQRRKDARAMPEQCTGDASQSPELDNTPLPPEGGGPAFEDFWPKVPQKLDKALCKKEWNKLSSADRIAATDAVADWYAWFKRVHPDATPTYPVRYLKHRKWEDEGWRPTASKQIQDPAKHYADKVKRGERISPFAVSTHMADEILSRGLATKDELRNAGVNV